MTVALSLFDDDDAVGLTDLSAARRIPLAHGAWVEHLPGWLTGSAAVFEALERDVPWRAERRQMYDRVVDVPRLVAWYDQGVALPHTVLDQARTALSKRHRVELGEDLVTAGLCFYRDGDDSVAWHGDTIGRSRTEDTVVAIVSLGTARPLLLRPRDGRSRPATHRFVLGHGDLLVMGGSCQRTWEHAVPKTRGVSGGRISVQFRVAGVR